MAKAMHYEVPKPPKPDAAREELDQLLQTLHEAGVLRLANDVLKASPEVSKIVLEGLNKEESRNAVQNLSLLAMGLGRIPPERFAVITSAVIDGLEGMEQAAARSERQSAPGLTGAFKLLHDQALWRGLYPLITAIKGFSRRLGERPEKPAAKRHG